MKFSFSQILNIVETTLGAKLSIATIIAGTQIYATYEAESANGTKPTLAQYCDLLTSVVTLAQTANITYTDLLNVIAAVKAAATAPAQ